MKRGGVRRYWLGEERWKVKIEMCARRKICSKLKRWPGFTGGGWKGDYAGEGTWDGIK